MKAKRKFFSSLTIFTLIFCFVAGLFTPLSGVLSLQPSAAGSDTLISNGGYRPYLEYSNDYTAGIERKTLIDVYLKKGETLCFGSSTYNSLLNKEGTSYGSAATGSDIVLYKPSGAAVSYDVIQNGPGHIGTVSAEAAGPNINGTAPDGYIPFEYTAESDGIYQLHFHSKNGSKATGIKNPKHVPVTSPWTDSDATVGAWDATVFGTEGAKKPGRISTKCLAMNMGNNSGVTLNSSVYVVTSDGYIYQTDFNGMNPYGFIFFANNRGLVSTDSNYSLYHSFVSNDTDLSDLIKQKATYQNPWNADTELDKTFSIFFEKPDPELEGILYPTAYVPEQAQNFSFIGSKGDNETHVGYGGYFKFDIKNASSATITIDMSDAVLENGTHVNYGKIKLNNPVSTGTNYFYWDGRSETGEIIPVGTYDSSSIKVSIETHSGEYHFPLFDVEAAADGIKVTRINSIYEEKTDSQGNFYNEDVSDRFEAGKSLIYYDNETRGADKTYHNAAGIIADGLNKTDGVDSSGGAMKFSTVSGNYSGDRTSLDIWTYSNNGVPSYINLGDPIIISDDPSAMLSGRVFYDSNNSSNWDLLNGDYAVTNAEVRLTYTFDDDTGAPQTVERTAFTDSDGSYKFFGVPCFENRPTDCTVEVVRPMSSYKLTTAGATTNENLTKGTEVQTVRLTGGSAYTPKVSLSDVGYHYRRTDKSITVQKDWVTDKAEDKERPQAVDVVITSHYMDGGTVVPVSQFTYTLNNTNGWSASTSALPAFFDEAETKALNYDVASETYTMRDAAATEYTFNYGDSSDAFPYQTEFLKEETLSSTVLTAVNAPKTGTIQIVKRDAEATELLLSEVTFVLWEKTDLTAIPPGGEAEYFIRDSIVYHNAQTKRTNGNGIVIFTDLSPNDYIVEETVPKQGYELNSKLFPFRVDPLGQQHFEQTIYNTKSTSTAISLTMKVKKVDGNDLKALPGAVFTVYSDSACTVPKISGSTILDAGGEATALFANLTPGTYYLKETAAPPGYLLPADAKAIVIQDDGSVAVDGAPITVTDFVFTITIANYLSVVFPQSGAAVTSTAVTAAGILLCVTAASLALKYRRHIRKGT